MMLLDERLVAIHEAAHAVAAVRFELLCDGANILPKAEAQARDSESCSAKTVWTRTAN